MRGLKVSGCVCTTRGPTIVSLDVSNSRKGTDRKSRCRRAGVEPEKYFNGLIVFVVL